MIFLYEAFFSLGYIGLKRPIHKRVRILYFTLLMGLKYYNTDLGALDLIRNF